MCIGEVLGWEFFVVLDDVEVFGFDDVMFYYLIKNVGGDGSSIVVI